MLLSFTTIWNPNTVQIGIDNMMQSFSAAASVGFLAFLSISGVYLAISLVYALFK